MYRFFDSFDGFKSVEATQNKSRKTFFDKLSLGSIELGLDPFVSSLRININI